MTLAYRPLLTGRSFPIRKNLCVKKGCHAAALCITANTTNKKLTDPKSALKLVTSHL